MAVIDVTYYTDPGCPWSWAAEPALRRIESEFGEQVRISYVMAGLAGSSPTLSGPRCTCSAARSRWTRS